MNVAMDLTVAATITSPTPPILGRTTLFVDALIQTDLIGARAGRLVLKISPGWRSRLQTPGREDWLLFGVDIPVSGPRALEPFYHFSYRKGF
jgi:hypothetical protein